MITSLTLLLSLFGGSFLLETGERGLRKHHEAAKNTQLDQKLRAACALVDFQTCSIAKNLNLFAFFSMGKTQVKVRPEIVEKYSIGQLAVLLQAENILVQSEENGCKHLDEMKKKFHQKNLASIGTLVSFRAAQSLLSGHASMHHSLAMPSAGFLSSSAALVGHSMMWGYMGVVHVIPGIRNRYQRIQQHIIDMAKEDLIKTAPEFLHAEIRKPLHVVAPMH